MRNLITLLFITMATLSHGMETIFQNKNDHNILLCLTKHLYPTRPLDGYHKYDVYDLGKNINSLSRTNKFFHTYFSSEKTGQTIVTFVAHHTKDTDQAISFYFNRYKNVFKLIQNNIERLFNIAADPNKQFTKEDLSDPWYVNATKGFGGSSTLLCKTYLQRQVQKIKDLINAKENIKNNELLADVAFNRYVKNDIIQKEFLTIPQLLLKHGADPNFCSNDNPPLLMAILYNDKEYAHLLLWYNANPYKTTNSKFYHNDFDAIGGENAFDLDKNDWFKAMFDERQQIIFNCWLFKHHNLKKHTLLPEIIKSIRYKVWKVSKVFTPL